MAKIRICGNPRCKHETKDIDIDNEEYKIIGRRYYHLDCYEICKEGDWKTNKEKADFQLIKGLWHDNINEAVVYKELFACLNNLLSQGISSDYLVFVVKYCIDHKCNLNYPAGIKYFAGNAKIKAAYEEKNKPKIKIDKDAFVTTDKETDSQQFSKPVNTKHPLNFSSILRSGGK